MSVENRVPSVRKQKIKKNHTKTRLIIFLILALALLLVAIFAQQLCPYDPNAQDTAMSLRPPSAAHPAGTDRFGRDMFSRILVGLQTSVLATLSLVVIITVIGTAVGVLCGYYGGIWDSVIMRISDVCLALNGGLHNAVLALAVISWPKYARIARSQTLAQKSVNYIAAAKLAGNNSIQVIVKHILPNCIGPILVTAMLDIGTMLMELAGLSFLGLGAQPPVAELGNMMSGGRSMLQTYPWVIIGPGIAIFIIVVIFNLLGDTVRDYLDPRNSRK
mgnify:CR=1 FL=1